MTIKETFKIQIQTFVRVKYDDGARDGIVLENEKDDKYMKIFFPLDEVISAVHRDQIYKAGKVLKFDFNDSGLWD